MNYLKIVSEGPRKKSAGKIHNYQEEITMKKSIKLLGATAIFAAIIPISAYAATITTPATPAAPTASVTAPAAAQVQDTTNDTETPDAAEAPEVKGAGEAKGAPEAVDPNEQAKLQQAATLTQQQATDIALKKVSGTVKSVELEDNNGTVVYGVHIVDANGKGSDVKVDAKTGAVLQADSDNNDGGSEN
jgi:uncharacterized membrane protein YkoI